MTKEESVYWLPLITALAEGKTIQFNYSGTGWANVDSIETHRRPSLYRVRPEPREFWIVDTGSYRSVWEEKPNEHSIKDLNNPEVIHVQEVLPE